MWSSEDRTGIEDQAGRTRVESPPGRPPLDPRELLQRFQECRDGNEKLRWQAVLLRLEGRATLDIADICKRRVDWVRRTVRRYDASGPDGMPDRRGGPFSSVRDEEGRAELERVIESECPPGGGLWTGKKVARWIGDRVGFEVSVQTGLNYLHSLGFTLQRPRPRHPEANEQEQEKFKKGGLKATFEW